MDDKTDDNFGGCGKIRGQTTVEDWFYNFYHQIYDLPFFPVPPCFPSETRISCLSVTKKNRTKLKGLKRLTYYFPDDFFQR